jgi:cytochrome oxidase Cu insertion factor (SCO1/SenC/PrrC family)
MFSVDPEVGLIDMKNTPIPIILAAALLTVALPAQGDEETMLESGMPFPAFDLPAHDGTTMSSADLEGNPYLLFFYPKADTGG